MEGETQAPKKWVNMTRQEREEYQAAKRASAPASVLPPAAPPTPPPAEAVAHVTSDAAVVQATPPRDGYKDEIERIRSFRKRQPFGTFHRKLALAERPGYHRHWFNDVPGRIDEAKLSGWSHVKDDKDNPLRRVVGTGRDKGALYAYAMEIPSVFWEEDKAERRRLARAPVDAIKSSPFKVNRGQSTPQDRDKFYSPREDVVDISTKTVKE